MAVVVSNVPTSTVYYEFDEQCENYPLEKLGYNTPETNPELLIIWEKERLLEWYDFKGEYVETLYNLTLKLQKHFLHLKSKNIEI